MRFVTRSSAGGFFSVPFVFLLLVCIHMQPALAQWEPEVRLTNAPDSSLAHEWYNTLAVSGKTVHLVWVDKRSGDWEIYYKRSVDDGASWGEDIILSENGSLGTQRYRPIPSLAVSGSRVHVVWYDNRTGTYELYYRRSLDGGATWDAEECLFYDMIWSWMPSVAAIGNTVHIVWSDARTGFRQSVYHMRSTDDGHTWGEARRLSDTGHLGSALGAKISISMARVYVSWYYYWNVGTEGVEETCYRLSTDGGENWWDEGNPAADAEYATGLTVQQSYPCIHYYWMEKQSGLWNLHYRHSWDAGLRWQPERSLRLQQTEYPRYSIAASTSTVHLAWKDDLNGLGVIQYGCSTDAGENWSDAIIISPLETKADNPTIAVSGTTLHLVWTDYRDGEGEVYYRRNPTGNPVSVAATAPLPEDIALDQNFPNPFHGSSTVRFAVPQRSRVVLTLHDLLGRRVATLREGEANAGSHHARIDAAALPAGSYLLRLCCGGVLRTRLITLLR